MTNFKLISYFSISSLLAFSLATVALTHIYQQQSIQDIISIEETKNIALTQIFANSFWQDLKPFLSSLKDFNYQEIIDNPKTFLLYQDLLQKTKDLSVIKIIIFDRQGKIIFSTEIRQIDDNIEPEARPRFAKALAGETTTVITYHETFQAFGKVIKNRRIISSYLPIIQEKNIEAVIQLYSDVTPTYQNIEQIQKKLFFSIVSILGILYLVLFLIIKRADRLLERQNLAQKKAEEALAKKVDELARHNAELEQFTYVASHDLQEPLRKIEAFGDRLKVKCASQLNEQGQDYITRMQKSARRMRTLIEDSLALSRLTTEAKSFIPVDLNSAIADVISELEIKLEETKGRVEMKDLPTISADPIQIHQLFQNLISNALKFHHPEEPPVVTIESKRLRSQPDAIEIAVKDNGIGFDEKYSDRIFQVFQRLHGRSEYEGTGIGLAICAKIVQRHNGSITAKSTPGKGSTFIIQFPSQQNADLREQ